MEQAATLTAIRCLGHGGAQVALADAALEGWKYCRKCHGFICPKCIESFRRNAEGQCPGSLTTGHDHPMELDELPYDAILRFTRRALSAPEVSPLLYELFFRHLQDEFEPLRVTESREEPQDDPVSVLRREQWRRYGLVLVKRRRGKYITWEQVC